MFRVWVVDENGVLQKLLRVENNIDNAKRFMVNEQPHRITKVFCGERELFTYYK